MSPATLGARPRDDGSVELAVWAPSARELTVRLAGRVHALDEEEGGIRSGRVPGAAGDDYVFLVDGRQLPDPCSRWQPEGVHGPSRVLDTESFDWGDDGWRGLDSERLVLYELHVGTFSEEGTFAGVIPELDRLRELGVTAIELMPVGTYPGSRGWGYDGLYTFAPHQAYGGPVELARLLDAAHRAGIGVILDVVYNHIGPGAEALTAFGPYFSERHQTFWGSGLDYDGPASEGVRAWAIENALLWVRDYHVDGLRLDAVHAIADDSQTHVLAELAERVHAVRPGALVISEMRTSDLRPIEEWGHDAQWADELHHELHVLLTGERDGYYERYGSIEGLVRALERPEGRRLVVAAQNHDQIGNRAAGDRLSPDALRVAAACVLFSPFTPLLFMGEEYGETAPFRFFTDHVDPEIAHETRAGRKREFERFASFGGEVPDPQALETFTASRLSRTVDSKTHELYRRLLALRPTLPPELEVRRLGDSALELQRGSASLRLDFRTRTLELRA